MSGTFSKLHSADQRLSGPLQAIKGSVAKALWLQPRNSREVWGHAHPGKLIFVIFEAVKIYTCTCNSWQGGFDSCYKSTLGGSSLRT